MPLLLCPNCNVSTQPVQRFGVEIDMCPQCRGVWLDRGELEKILEMDRGETSSAGSPPVGSGASDSRPYRETERRYDQRHQHNDDEHHGFGQNPNRHGRRKPSLFDFFD